MSTSMEFPTIARRVAGVPSHSLLAFVLLRQVAAGCVLLLLVLVTALATQRRYERRRGMPDLKTQELEIAA